MASSSSTGFPVQFGKYTLLRKLAMGGMAELFLAKDPGREVPVVIKRVLPHFTEDTEFLTMFLNEARIAVLLDHPGIVGVYDLGREEEHLFIAMEYIDGRDLETLAHAAGGVPPEIATAIGIAICDALYYANTKTDPKGTPLNVIHRDVTPGNVMISRAGAVKLVDFGVAKATTQGERTRAGVVKGKFRYMSPEQVELKELDGRSDLFSLGVLLYEVTTGVKPFDRKQILDVVRAISRENPKPPAEIISGYPKPLSDVIMQALAKDRDKRFATARDMKLALEKAMGTKTGPADIAAFLTESERARPRTSTKGIAVSKPAPRKPELPAQPPRRTLAPTPAATPDKGTPAKGSSTRVPSAHATPPKSTPEKMPWEDDEEKTLCARKEKDSEGSSLPKPVLAPPPDDEEEENEGRTLWGLPVFAEAEESGEKTSATPPKKGTRESKEATFDSGDSVPNFPPPPRRPFARPPEPVKTADPERPPARPPTRQPPRVTTSPPAQSSAPSQSAVRVRKATQAPAPARRPPVEDEVEDSLTESLSGQEDSQAPPRRSPIRLILVALLFVFLGVAFAGWWLTTRGSHAPAPTPVSTGTP